MAVEKFTIPGKKGITLHGIKTVPKKAPKAVIQIFHGMGEYKDRYIPFMEFLAQEGYACYAHDQRNHGESLRGENMEGIYLKDERWDDILDDCYLVTRLILKDFPGTKLVVMGHSMGSVIARGFMAKNPLLPKAAIIMGSLTPPKGMLVAVTTFIARTVGLFTGKKRSPFIHNLLHKPAQSAYENPRTPLDWLNNNEEEVDIYIEDPLCGFNYTPHFYIQFVKAVANVNKSDTIMKSKDIPMLFISGAEDVIGGNGEGVKQTVETFNGHGYTQLTLKLMENMRHEILHEYNKELTFNEVKEWLEKAV